MVGGRSKNREKLLGAATPIMCGGARAAWLQTNDAGMVNCIRSLVGQLTQKLGPRRNIVLKGQALVHALTTIATHGVNYELELEGKLKLIPSSEALQQ